MPTIAPTLAANLTSKSSGLTSEIFLTERLASPGYMSRAQRFGLKANRAICGYARDI
jgi:hypothetical protein